MLTDLEREIMKILVGLAPGDVAKHLFETALTHAQHFDAKVYLVTSLKGSSNTSDKEVEKAENGLKYAESMFQKSGILCEVHLMIRGNSPGTDLFEFAQENGIDEIIVGARKRSAVGKALLGSVTQSVALSATCPVVLVK